MDPKKQMNQLDPKLKEVYDRVMGTTVQPSTTTAAAAPTAASAAVQPATVPHATPPSASSATPQTTTIATQPQQIVHMDGAASHSVLSAGSLGKKHIEEKTGADGTAKKGNGMGPVLFIIGGIIVLIVYTFVWLTIFKVKLPFLP